MTRPYPDSIAGWTIVVLVAALTAMQVATVAITSGMRSDTLEAIEHFHSAERIAGIVRIMDAVDPAQRLGLLARIAGDTLGVAWDPEPAVGSSHPRSWSESLFDEIIGAALWQAPERAHRVALRASVSTSFGERVSVLKRTAGDRRRARTLDSAADTSRGGRVMSVAVALADGSWLNFEVPMADPPAAPGLDVILQIAGFGLLIVALSLWAVRRLTQPLTMMAQAAEQLGRNVNAPPLPVAGSRELRQAARAFNAMQERIRQFVTGRLQFIAAISHDLRTPLTRLRLRAELAENDEMRNRMKADVAEMEAMIESVLTFARQEEDHEARMPVDLVSLVESVCDGLPAVSVEIDASAGGRLVYECQPLALRRCIGNLVSNAVKYGRTAQVTLSVAQRTVVVTVDDEGDGIAAVDRERVFLPFVRLEESRNHESGGAGLGLVVARQVARNHGGDVSIENRPQGGLRAVLRLPLPS